MEPISAVRLTSRRRTMREITTMRICPGICSAELSWITLQENVVNLSDSGRNWSP